MTQHKKRTIIACAAGVVVLLISAAAIYLKLYYIDENQLNFCVGQGSFESPDGNYVIEIGVYPIGDVPPALDNSELLPYIVQNEIDAYVVGRLKWDPEVQPDGSEVWTGENSKILFFDQYDGSEISVVWEGKSTVVINGIALEVPNQMFDYRRNW